MFIPSAIYGCVLGTVLGCIWAFAINTRLPVSAVVGAITGIVVTAILAVVGKLARAGGKLQVGETYFASNAVLTFLAVAGAAIGIIVWIVRALMS